MRTLSRVVWSEGMHLAQHHFQAQARYFEELAAFGLESLFFKPHGLVAARLDEEALRNGTVSVIHARGVMPDGLVFQFPEDPPPQPLEIRELFSPTQDSHVILLAIPAYRADRSNCAPEGARTNGSDYRFVASSAAIVDEITGQDEKPVGLARKNFRLLLDAQPTEGLVTLPLARVRRDGSGHFIYDPDYIPPCIQIGASGRLMEILGRLVEMLDAKAEAVAAERRGADATLAEYASREVASFWLSHAIHSALAPLRHQLQTRTEHPEQLYLELSRLAGALCTFSFTSHPRTLPAYDHEQLTPCFEQLERHIRDHLDIILPTNCVSVPLVPVQQFFYTGKVVDRRSFGRAHWFLGVRSSASPGEVAGRVPKLVKLCSAKHIVRLVKEAFPGLALEHVPTPPSALSPRLGVQYFTIEGRGNPAAEACWKSIIETGELGVYAPAAIPDAELEVKVVVEG